MGRAQLNLAQGFDHVTHPPKHPPPRILMHHHPPKFSGSAVEWHDRTNRGEIDEMRNFTELTKRSNAWLQMTFSIVTVTSTANIRFPWIVGPVDAGNAPFETRGNILGA